jgi:hypothetical protein
MAGYSRAVGQDNREGLAGGEKLLNVGKDHGSGFD